MQFHRENKQKSHKSLFERLSKNTWKYMKFDQAMNTSTKKYMNTSTKTSIHLYVG